MAYTTSTNDAQEIKRIDFTAFRRQRFLVDIGDGAEHILELNLNDIGVVTRLNDGYSRLTQLDENVSALRADDSTINESDNTETAHAKLMNFAEKLKTIDIEMRSIIDYIFDSNVSEVCCPSGSMYDPVNGKLRYEYILDTLSEMYSDTLANEMKKVTSRMKSHTAKYTGKK